MLIWFALFFIILITSFILALRSMKDFRESPANFHKPYSLFLIQNPHGLTLEVLNQFTQLTKQEGQILSLERLFKGGRKALVVFGPLSFLKSFEDKLQLLELEDYSYKIKLNQESGANKVIAWEIGAKSNFIVNQKFSSIDKDIPALDKDDELWFQVVLQPLPVILGLKEGQDTSISNPSFQSVLRVVLSVKESERASKLQSEVNKIGNTEGLAPLPQVYSTAQIVKFYQDRALQPAVISQLVKDKSSLSLNGEQILALVKEG